MANLEKIELASHLLPEYIKIIRQNISNPEFIERATHTLHTYLSFTCYIIEGQSSETRKEIAKELLPLLDTLLEGITKMPDENSSPFKKVFSSLVRFSDEDKEIQESIANLLSKHYFQKDNFNIQRVFDFIDALDIVIPQNEVNHPKTSQPVYTVLKVVDDNFDYFISARKELIKRLQDPMLVNDEALTLNRLVRLFESFVSLPNIESKFYSSPEKEPEDLALREKITIKSENEIQKPIIEAIFSSLEDMEIPVKVHINKEIYVSTRRWNLFRDSMIGLSCQRKDVLKGFKDLLTERLVRDGSPYKRKLAFESLEHLLEAKNSSATRYETLKQLTNGFVYSSSNTEAEGISKVLVSIIANEKAAEEFQPKFNPKTEKYEIIYKGPRLSYREFVNQLTKLAAIEKDNDGLMTSFLCELGSSELSPAQTFIVNMLITVQDIRYCMGDMLEKDGIFLGTEESAKNDLLTLMKIHHNTSLVLANSASMLPEYKLRVQWNKDHGESYDLVLDYRKAIYKILEQNFDFYYLYSNPEEWAENIAELIKLSREIGITGTERDAFLKDRLDYYKRFLFGFDGAFSKYEDSLLLQHMNEMGIFKNIDGLNEGQERKFRSAISEKLHSAKLDFAERFLECAPEGSLGTYKSYLNELGFSEYETNNLHEKILSRYTAVQKVSLN